MHSQLCAKSRLLHSSKTHHLHRNGACAHIAQLFANLPCRRWQRLRLSVGLTRFSPEISSQHFGWLEGHRADSSIAWLLDQLRTLLRRLLSSRVASSLVKTILGKFMRSTVSCAPLRTRTSIPRASIETMLLSSDGAVKSGWIHDEKRSFSSSSVSKHESATMASGSPFTYSDTLIHWTVPKPPTKLQHNDKTAQALREPKRRHSK